MEIMADVCLCIILLIALCLRMAGSNGYSIIKKYIYSMFGVFLFSLMVGLRYTPDADIDFVGYCDIVENWDNHFYYSHLELIPRLYVDLVNMLKLPTYIWFILMGASLIILLLFASNRFDKQYSYLIFVWLILLYFTFDMNVVRQGVALTAYLCAVTYIYEKKWKMYLLFVIIAFSFHRSSIIWSPAYFLSCLDWEKSWMKINFYGVIAVCFIMLFITINIGGLEYVFGVLGQSDKLENVQRNGIDKTIKLGSGFGIFFRYIRWIFVLYYVPKIIKINEHIEIKLLFFLFLIGVVIDPFSMFSISMGRIAYYLQFIEILLLVYLWKYSGKLRDNILIKSVLGFQMLVLTTQICVYFNKWNFVNL